MYYQDFKPDIKQRMNFLQTIKSLLRLEVVKHPLSDGEQKELNLAIIELMLEMVRADFVELHTEKKALIALLTETLDMSETDVLEHIANAEIRSDFSLSITTQTNVINNFLNKSEKADLLRVMWLLANADQEVHLLESQLINQAGQLLGFRETELKQLCETA